MQGTSPEIKSLTGSNFNSLIGIIKDCQSILHEKNIHVFMNTCIMKMSAKTIANSYFCPKNHLFKYEEVPLRTTPITNVKKILKIATVMKNYLCCCKTLFIVSHIQNQNKKGEITKPDNKLSKPLYINRVK